MSRLSYRFKATASIFLLSFQILRSQVSDEQAQAVVFAWKAAKQSIDDDAILEPERIIEAAINYRSFLAGTPDTSLQQHLFAKGGEELIDYTLAKAWAKAGNYENSLNSLIIAASQQGIFLHSTRNPGVFANDVFALHSEIMANIGKVIPIPNAGYEVFAARSNDGALRFVFVYEPEGNDDGGVRIDGLAESDQRQWIGLYEPSGKGYHLVDRAQVIGRRDHVSVSARSSTGGLNLVFNGVVKIIEYKGELEIPFVHPSANRKLALHIADGKIEQPLHALVSAENGSSYALLSDADLTSFPSDRGAVKLRNYSNPRVTAQNVTPISRAWWELVVILTVALIGLPWMILKGKR